MRFPILIVCEAFIVSSLLNYGNYALNFTDDIIVPEGEKVTLDCNVQDEPVIWKINGIVLKALTKWRRNFKLAPNSSLLLVNPVLENVSGEFNVTCDVNITDPTDTKNHRVYFAKGPRFSTNSTTILLTENTLVYMNIDCSSAGYPKPTIWWKVGKNILASINGTVRSDLLDNSVDNGGFIGTFRIFNNGTLNINGSFTQTSISSDYLTCVASNSAGRKLQVHHFGFEKLQTYSFEVILPGGQLLNLEDKVREKVRSIFKPGKLYHSLNITSINSKNGSVQFDLTWKEKRLNKTYGTPRNAAKLADDVYRALIEGNLTPKRFRIHAPPAPPVQLEVINVNTDTVTVGWDHPKHFDIRCYHVLMLHVSNKMWKNLTVPGVKKRVTIGELDSDTMYNLTIYSENKYGVGQRKSNVLQVETTKTSTKDFNVVIVVIVLLMVAAAVAIVLGTIYYRRRKRHFGHLGFKLNPYKESIPGVPPENIFAEDKLIFCPNGQFGIVEQKEYFSWKEISRDALLFGDILGQGEFGLVVKATLISEGTSDIQVAVKSVKDIATESDRKELFKELRLMANVGDHANIVNLVGACSRAGPLLVIVEYCEHGSLLSYLKKHRQDVPDVGNFMTTLDEATRVRFAYDVSKGMKYLEEKKIVHRDLAARNILLGKRKIAKVSDFGLSRDIYDTGLYQKTTTGRLPARWMAIESLLEAVYTSKSDVWSFAVLMWEIETAGMVPYGGVESLELLEYLLRGSRLAKPIKTVSEIYEIMTSCWVTDPDCRPSFAELALVLEVRVEKDSNYIPVVIDEDQDGKRLHAYVNYPSVI